MAYSMRVTGAFKDTLDRQMMERVRISGFRGPVLMNRKNEMGASGWRGPSTGGGEGISRSSSL